MLSLGVDVKVVIHRTRARAFFATSAPGTSTAAPLGFVEPEGFHLGVGQRVDAVEQLLGKPGAFLRAQAKRLPLDVFELHGFHGGHLRTIPADRSLAQRSRGCTQSKVAALSIYDQVSRHVREMPQACRLLRAVGRRANSHPFSWAVPVQGV